MPSSPSFRYQSEAVTMTVSDGGSDDKLVDATSPFIVGGKFTRKDWQIFFYKCLPEFDDIQQNLWPVSPSSWCRVTMTIHRSMYMFWGQLRYDPEAKSHMSLRQSAFMMTSSNGNIFLLLAICAGNSPVPGEFPTQRPETRSFDVYFVLRPNKRFSKQLWGWWFEKQSRPLWRHRNVIPKGCF